MPPAVTPFDVTRVPNITVSQVPPAVPTTGDLWFDSYSGREFVYFTDASGSQWVVTQPQGGSGEPFIGPINITFGNGLIAAPNPVTLDGAVSLDVPFLQGFFLPLTGGTLEGNQTIHGTLTVTGTTTLDDTLVDGNLAVNGDTGLKNTSIDGPLEVSGNSDFQNVTVEGTLVVVGTTGLGVATAATPPLGEDSTRVPTTEWVKDQGYAPASSVSFAVSDLTALKALPAPTTDTTVFTRERAAANDGGAGEWTWRSGNQSANVTLDPMNGLWAPPSSDPTGASGAWQRIVAGDVFPRWFGANATGSIDDKAILAQAASAAVRLGRTLNGDKLWYGVDGIWEIPDGTLLVDIKLRQITAGTGRRTLMAAQATGPFNLKNIVIDRNGLPDTAGTSTDNYALFLAGNGPVAISGLSWSSGSGGVATVTLSSSSSAATGDTVIISDATRGYCGTFVITKTGSTTFTYPLIRDPGTATVFGTANFVMRDVVLENVEIYGDGAGSALFVGDVLEPQFRDVHIHDMRWHDNTDPGSGGEKMVAFNIVRGWNVEVHNPRIERLLGSVGNGPYWPYQSDGFNFGICTGVDVWGGVISEVSEACDISGTEITTDVWFYGVDIIDCGLGLKWASAQHSGAIGCRIIRPANWGIAAGTTTSNIPMMNQSYIDCEIIDCGASHMWGSSIVRGVAWLNTPPATQNNSILFDNLTVFSHIGGGVGSITSGLLTLSSLTWGNAVVGQLVIGSGVDPGAYILSGAGLVWQLGVQAEAICTIAGTTLTVSGSVTTGAIQPGMEIYNPNTTTVALGTTIVSGAHPTWTVNISQTVSTPTFCIFKRQSSQTLGSTNITLRSNTQYAFRFDAGWEKYIRVLNQRTIGMNTAEYIGATPLYLDKTRPWDGYREANGFVSSNNLPVTVINGTISGTTLTLNNRLMGQPAVGQTVYGDGVTTGTIIMSGSGTVWTVNKSQSAGPTTMWLKTETRVTTIGNGSLVVRYDDNTAAVPIALQNFDIEGTGQGALVTTAFSRPSDPSTRILAGRYGYLSTNDWTVTANQDSKFYVEATRDGVNGLAFDADRDFFNIGGLLSVNNNSIGAGAANQYFIRGSSTANYGVFYGTGAPTFAAAKSSIYLRADAGVDKDLIYWNTDGGTTWKSLLTI